MVESAMGSRDRAGVNGAASLPSEVSGGPRKYGIQWETLICYQRDAS